MDGEVVGVGEAEVRVGPGEVVLVEVGVGEVVAVLGEEVGDGEVVVLVGDGEAVAVLGEDVGDGEAVVLVGDGDGETLGEVDGDEVGVGDVVTAGAGADPEPGQVCDKRIPESEFKISAYEPD